MAWSVEDFECHAADVDALAIVEQARAVLAREPVLPIASPFRGQEQRRPGARRQLTASTHEVRVDVRFGHVRDAYRLGRGGRDVLGGITIRIDDDRLARGFAADEIARLGELGVDMSYPIRT
jgi:hypothetical protein